MRKEKVIYKENFANKTTSLPQSYVSQIRYIFRLLLVMVIMIFENFDPITKLEKEMAGKF